MSESTQVPRPPHFERAESEIEYWEQFTIPECPRQLVASAAAGEVCQNGDLNATGSKVTVSIKSPQSGLLNPCQESGQKSLFIFQIKLIGKE